MNYDNALNYAAFGIFAAAAFSLGFLWIRGKYRKYCSEMDEEDRLRSETSSYEKRISAMVASITAAYGGGLSGTISRNVRDKVDFSLNILKTFPVADRARLTERLYGLVYETCTRIESNPEDVMAVTSPLTNFCMEIGRNKIEFIRKILEDA
jgi:hypothetical protein